MSASKEKKTRQEQTASGWADPKTAREAQQRREEKRSNLLYLIIAIVFVVVAVVSLTWRSGILQKNATAVSINGEKYNAAEVQYYYTSQYQYFVNNYYYYLSSFGLDINQSLKSQACGLSEDGGTWYDYFLKQGLTQMCDMQAISEAAEADGFVWNDERQAEFDASIASLEENVASYNSSKGTKLDLEDYLKQIFGSVMTQKVYEQELKRSILAQAYTDNYTDSLTYSQDQLDEEYAANANTYDRVDYQAVTIKGTAASATDADGNTVAPTEEESAAALADAKALADSIYAGYQNGGSLETLAKDEDTASYADQEGSAYSDAVLQNWLFDEKRESGDSAVLADTDASTYYVVVFGSRYRYEYNTVDVRHVLVQVDSSELDTASETYDADLKAKQDEAKAKAEELLAQWRSGEATEESFAALANENSEDPGSNTTGGLYEQIAKGQMVAEFNDWCFDEARKPGDTGVVSNESTGCHVMYFVGDDEPYWKVQVTQALQSNDFTSWYEELTADYTATQHSFGMKAVG